MQKNVHAGHRDRVKKEFIENKFSFSQNTPPHKVLELLLFFCVRQADTNPLAHQLLERYQSIAGVLDAPVGELITYDGLTESNVILLKMIMPLARIYRSDKQNLNSCFRNVSEIGDFLLDPYMGLCEERLSILSLDGNCRKLSFDFISTGDMSSVGVSTRDIIQLTLKTGATCVVMAHNHPGGIALPSGADVAITEMVSTALSHIGVKLVDHIIIANDDYISMMQSKQYKYLFEQK